MTGASDVVDGLRRTREDLEDVPPGPEWLRRWTGAVDAALRDLAAGALDGSPPEVHEAGTMKAGHLGARTRPAGFGGLPLALVAVGGYGRGELCPGSDVDVLLLHDGVDGPALEQAVRAVIYPLWDAKLDVGYAVRSRREALSAIEELDAATSMIDARVLAGDRDLVHRTRTEVLRRIRRRPARLLDALARADRARHARAGDAAEMLEPDLKNGAGGLRDVDSLRWASAALVGTSELDALVAAGYIGAADRGRLARARALLLEVRIALHHLADGTDVLRMDLHDEVARLLGHRDRGTVDLAAHGLLRELYLATRTIDHVHRRAWRLIDADAGRGVRRRRRPAEQTVDGFELVDRVLRLADDAPLDSHDLPVRLLDALCSTGAILDRDSAARLRTHAAGDAPGWTWDRANLARFTSVLLRGAIALPAVFELDDAGVLTTLLPGWEVVRGRAQRNPFHRYCLDRHAWHAVAELGELVRREAWAASALEEVADREGLLLGVLFHDVGKAVGEPHSDTGAPVAAALARHMGAPEATVTLVERLTRLHLVLVNTARTRDVADPEIARQVAGQVGDRRTLACLLLLTAADGLATGPTAWNDWIATLVRSLATKVAAVLDDIDPDHLDDGPAASADEAQRIAAEMGADAAAVREHLALLSSRYAGAMAPRAIVRHTLMATTPPSPAEIRTRVTPGDADPDGVDDVDELDVVAHDHPGLFAQVAGVIALHSGEIVAADAFTRDDGLAVDTFRVRPPEGAGGSWWARVEGDLADAAAGRLAVRARVARRARDDRRRAARRTPVETSVRAETDASGRFTIIEVRTLDRLGVLFAITDALAELKVDIVVARITTIGHEAVDVFTCRDAAGAPLDADHVSEIDLAVSSAIEAL